MRCPLAVASSSVVTFACLSRANPVTRTTGIFANTITAFSPAPTSFHKVAARDAPAASTAIVSRVSSYDSQFVYGSFPPTSTDRITIASTTTYHPNDIAGTSGPLSTWSGTVYSTLYSTQPAVTPTMYFYANTDCSAQTDPNTGEPKYDSFAAVPFDWDTSGDCTTSYAVPSPTATPSGASNATWGSVWMPNVYTSSNSITRHKDLNGYDGGRGISCALNYTGKSAPSSCGLTGKLLSGSQILLRMGPSEGVSLEYIEQVSTAPLPRTGKYYGHGPVQTKFDEFAYKSDSCFTFDAANGYYLDGGTTFNCRQL